MTSDAVRAKYEEASRLLKDSRHVDALHVYRSLAEAGVQDAQLFYQLGWMILKGLGTTPNTGEAEEWFSRAADLGSAAAQYSMAVFLVERAEYEAARLRLERAANQGFTPAMYYLGRMYELGRWGPLDRTKAKHYFEEAAARGHVWAERQLAAMLVKGEEGLLGIPRGVKRFVSVIVRAWKLKKREPDSEYLFS